MALALAMDGEVSRRLGRQVPNSNPEPLLVTSVGIDCTLKLLCSYLELDSWIVFVELSCALVLPCLVYLKNAEEVHPGPRQSYPHR